MKYQLQRSSCLNSFQRHIPLNMLRCVHLPTAPGSYIIPITGRVRRDFIAGGFEPGTIKTAVMYFMHNTRVPSCLP